MDTENNLTDLIMYLEPLRNFRDLQKSQIFIDIF